MNSVCDTPHVVSGNNEPVKLCCHCQKLPANRPRGLCWKCYYNTPGVREQHRSTSKFANRGISLGHVASSRLPDAATRATPGSPEKVAVMESRCKARVALWHPDDPSL